MADKNIIVGTYKESFNHILGLCIVPQNIYRSTGLPAHMIKRKHFKCLKYIDYIPEIINNPDYIGINPNINGSMSIELIKRYRDNVLIGIKMNEDGDKLYVSTMHDVQESKIQRRLHSGRLKDMQNY